jgi:uncharacterized membrane-anchored protein YitT (DUF2179 family)
MMKLVRGMRSEAGGLGHIVWHVGLIIVGSALCAVAINGILIPRQFLSGGFTGLSLVIYYLLPFLPVGGLYFLFNIPLFILGWRFVGRRFFLYSIAGMFIFSAAVQWLQVSLPVYDQLLSALLAGIISGVGSGIILRSWGSAGGTDILSVILAKRFSIRLGTTILAFNSVILLAAAVLLSLESALYTLIYLFVASYILNIVVTGFSQRKAVYIISPRWKEISKGIIEEINRGTTIIRGQGGFSGKEHRMVYTVITFRELARLKRLIHRLDPDAFVVVSDTLEVMGQKIGNQPHW